MPDRKIRIENDFAALAALASSSTVFSFVKVDGDQDRFIWRFRGKGLTKGISADAIPELQSEHELEVRLPMMYPDTGPDVRWLSPIFHPNVSYSGFVLLADVDLDWNSGMGLDVVCERMWDVIRLERANLERATNPAAKRWWEEQKQFALPLDARPLRDRAALANRNVVRYQRRGEPPLANYADRDVLYIDEDTSTTSLPSIGASVVRHRSPPDDDVLYIE